MIKLFNSKINSRYLTYTLNCFDEDKNDMSPMKKIETSTIDDCQQKYKCEWVPNNVQAMDDGRIRMRTMLANCIDVHVDVYWRAYWAGLW